MKKTFTTSFTALLLSAIALLDPQQATAQDDKVEGYANVYLKVKAVPDGGGQVFPYFQESSIKVWKSDWDFKQAVPVGTIMGSYISMFYLYNKSNTADGYTFGGWYEDDGNGVFDLDKDVFLGNEEEYVYMTVLDDNITIYPTQAAAKSGIAPSEPTATIFAYFTRGARVGLSYYQDDYNDLHANSGTVWISKTANEPGDQVTVRAIPNDGYQFEYWQDADSRGNIITRENPYTFTVQGGERLYAYFTATDSPVLEFPEEGGYRVEIINDSWVPTDEALNNGFHVYVFEGEDLVRTDEGKIYLDASKPEAQLDVIQWKGRPSLLYGKGQVRFAYKLKFGWGRESVDLVQWSGNNGVTLTGDVIYVYVFVPELGAFIQFGTTDELNINATPSVKVPAQLAYFSMSAFDLTDDQGNIPTVIGLSPETYDLGMSDGKTALENLLNEVLGIGDVHLDTTTIRGQRVYTLSGVEVKTTPEKGVYIVNGKKVVLK